VSLKATLLRTAASFRHGIVLPPEQVEPTLADIGGLTNMGVPANSENPWAGATGGIGWDVESAEGAAVGEALERYAAAAFPLPEQRRSELRRHDCLDADAFSLYSEEQRSRPDFPHEALYREDVAYTNMFSLTDNRETWVPAALVRLDMSDGDVATSTGLAAGATPYAALLRAVQELIERDALAVTWLHGVLGRRVDLVPRHAGVVAKLGGEAIAVDATPAYSPHPVALVAGHLPVRGTPRVALGAACRETWAEAVDKAFLEWVQGVSFAGFHLELGQRPAPKRASELKTFDDHAVYYTDHWEEWTRIPLLRGGCDEPPNDGPSHPASESLAQLADGLAREGIRVFYRELTTADLADIGVCVIRALSPDLAPLACDEEWRFLGGTVADVSSRYPWAVLTNLTFPSHYPHPLG
jgi:ribosomal protein S12 methylthiotransferase accessory factor